MVQKSLQTPSSGLTDIGRETPESPVKTPLTAPAPRPRKPRRMALRVVVACADRRVAERMAQARTLGGLEELLAELVSDIVTAQERPGSWEAERVNAWVDSHYPPPSWIRRERSGFKKEGV